MNRQDAKLAEKQELTEPSTELDALAHRVIGAALEVHRLLGPGFLESVYEQALCVELTLRGVRFVRQVPVSVAYQGHEVRQARLDLLVGERLVVELKIVEAFAPIHIAQILSYLRASRLRLGGAHHLQCREPSARHKTRHTHLSKTWRSWRLGGLFWAANRDSHSSWVLSCGEVY